MIKIKRVYERSARDDGIRVLVDRMWPRGVTKEAARVRQWLRELGPSDELRKFFNHDPARWNEFRKRYRQELKAPHVRRMLRELANLAAENTITFVYSARDEVHNQAVVLREVLDRMTAGQSNPKREPRRTGCN